MTWLRIFAHRLCGLLLKRRAERELEEEIRTHLEMQIEDNLRRGMNAADARYAALRKFGGVEQMKDRYRDRRGLPLVESTLRDLRYALRMLGRNPGFTIVAVLTLGLGIGANTAIFSMVYALMLRPLPYAEPDRLMLLTEKMRTGDRMTVAYPNFVDWRERTQTFEEMSAYRTQSFNLTGVEKPTRLRGRAVTWNFFRLLGVFPQHGRSFIEQDDQPGATRTVLLGHQMWKDRFGGDPGFVGKTILLDGDSYTVIGVMPPDFEYIRKDDFYVPLGLSLGPNSNLLSRGNHPSLLVLGRLKRGYRYEQARAEMATLAGQLENAYPETNSGQSATAQTLQEYMTEEVSQSLWVLLGAVSFILLIACVNVSNLLLIRAADRNKEIALRLALGAGRGRIVRQFLNESLLIAGLGGIAGLLIGRWMVSVLVSLAPEGIPLLNRVGLDLTVLLFTLGVSLVTSILCGLLPALHSSRVDLQTALKEGGRSTSGGGREVARRTLMVVEVALALTLLIGAGLLVRSMVALLRVDPGFDSQNLLTMRLMLSGKAYDVERARNFYDECLTRIGALPGVRSAALTLSLPIDGSNWNSIFIAADKPVPARADLPSSAFIPVSKNYFEAMGIRLLNGRAFTTAETANSPTVTVINEALARRLWPGENPIGKRLKQGWPEDKNPWREVVGVVADLKLNGMQAETPLQAYLPIQQEVARNISLVARTTGDPMSLAQVVENAIHELDKDLPIFSVRTMDQLLGNSVATRRLTLTLLASLAALALLLAAVGIYGVVSHSVRQRTHEIGVRIALGAPTNNVLVLVVKQGMTVALIGVTIGVIASLILTRLMASLLFGVAAIDPLTFGAIALLLIFIAFMACLIPARRATKVDPVIALRCE
jgi:predicted permease